MSKPLSRHLSNLAQHAKAIYDIIKAAIGSGLHGAAVAAVKHYWPQILVIAVCLLLLPVILFAALPSMLFGFGGSDDAEIAAMNSDAAQLRGYYTDYQDYMEEYVEKLKLRFSDGVSSIAASSENTTGTAAPDTVSQITTEKISYKVRVMGKPMDREWFIAFYSVAHENDLTHMNEQTLRDFVPKLIRYEIRDDVLLDSSTVSMPWIPSVSQSEQPTGKPDSLSQPSQTESSEYTTSNLAVKFKFVTISYLTPKEYMAELSAEDRNWAELLHQSLIDGGADIFSSKEAATNGNNS